MRIGEAVGGAALVGVAVLVGIALTDDDPRPESVTADTSAFVFAATTSPAAASSDANTPSPSAETTTSAAAAAPTTAAAPAATVPAAPAPAMTAAPTPTLIPPERRAGIAVRVLNGGAPSRAATMMSSQLRGAGFAPAGPADAVRLVPVTKVVFAPGRELDAATVNDVVRARPENVVQASVDDPNWTEFGEGLSVLVVLGPPGT